MSERPDFDPARLAFTQPLIEGWEAIRDEAMALREDDYYPWWNTGIYQGRWDLYPLVGTSADAPFPTDSEGRCIDHADRCPRTTEALLAIPGIEVGAFSRLAAGATILPHCDDFGWTVLRAHLGLSVPPGCHLVLAGTRLDHVEGQLILFDTALEHAAFNPTADDRIVLVMDLRAADHDLGRPVIAKPQAPD